MVIAQILKRRALVVCLALVLVLFGVNAFEKLPLEAYPDVANMQVRVITQVPGKAAEEVERLVTIPIEKELNGVPRSEPPRSISIFGLSVITVVFEDGVDPYSARQQVLERLTLAEVPAGVKPELDPNASPVGEIFRYTVEGKRYTTMRRKEEQDWLLNRKIRSVPGIVECTGFGGPTKTYQVELDPGRLQALGITQEQVAEAIARSNGSTGGSFIIQNDQNFMVRGLGLLKTVEDIRDVVVAADRDGVPLHVHDVAQVAIGPAVRRGQVGCDDRDDVVEGIVLMRRGENPSTAIANLRAVWPELQAALPSGMHIVPLYDRTALVTKTVNTIGHNVAEGVFLVVALLMLFLFQVRSAIICAAVIPLALLTAFILLNVFKVPANLLSIGAIDFGIIVDGAVIMVENIVSKLAEVNHRRIAAGLTGRPELAEVIKTVAAGAQEVAKPILFSTAIICLTFLPILCFERVEGKLFRPLAITMNFNLIGAVLVTMTLVPVLCAIIYAWKLPKERTSPLMRFAKFVYLPTLKRCLKMRTVVALMCVAIFAGSLLLTPLMGTEFLPELEEGNIWIRTTILPTSVSLDKAVELAHELRRIIKSYPEVTTVVTQIGSPDDGTDPNPYSTIEVLVDLKGQDEWRKEFNCKDALVESMEKQLVTNLPGLLFNFSQYIKDNMDETIGGVKGELGVKIYGSDLAVLTKLGSEVKQVVSAVPGMVDVSVDQLLGQPQLQIDIDRLKASRYGINTNDILDIVETSIGGKSITHLLDGEKRFDVTLRYSTDYRNEESDLNNILVPSPSGQRIPLVQLTKITQGHGASTILRERNERRIAVKANIRGRDLGSAVEQAQRDVASKIKLPEGYHIVWAGQFERAKHAMGQLSLVVPVTLGLVFLLLYSAFGSASLAALIMLTVPLAASGGILALVLSHTHFSISAGVGFIALFGVAIQNGVILTSKIRDLEKSGMDPDQAALEGAIVRMPPVAIAAIVAFAGLLPAALSDGIGSQSQRPFAIVIVGGLLPATALTLLFLPALYRWFSGKVDHHKEKT